MPCSMHAGSLFCIIYAGMGGGGGKEKKLNKTILINLVFERISTL